MENHSIYKNDEKLILSVQKISKRFGSKVVIENLSFDVFEGEKVSILGVSGCGKTTTLRIIAGLERPSDGYINFNKGSYSDLGFISQKLYIFDWLRVKENIEFGLKAKGINDPQIVNAILSNTGLKEFENYYPYILSGGMLQRLAIARVLVLKPKLILMDEPFGDLDIINKDKLYEFINFLNLESKITFLIVTHDINEAINISDKILIFSSSPTTILSYFEIKNLINENEKNDLKNRIQSMLKMGIDHGEYLK